MHGGAVAAVFRRVILREVPPPPKTNDVYLLYPSRGITLVT